MRGCTLSADTVGDSRWQEYNHALPSSVRGLYELLYVESIKHVFEECPLSEENCSYAYHQEHQWIASDGSIDDLRSSYRKSYLD